VSAAARRSILVGSGCAPPVKKIFSKVHEKMSFYPKKIVDDLFLVINRKLQQNKYTAKMASAAHRQIIGGGGGAPINKSRRRRHRALLPTPMCQIIQLWAEEGMFQSTHCSNCPRVEPPTSSYRPPYHWSKFDPGGSSFNPPPKFCWSWYAAWLALPSNAVLKISTAWWFECYCYLNSCWRLGLSSPGMSVKFLLRT